MMKTAHAQPTAIYRISSTKEEAEALVASNMVSHAEMADALYYLRRSKYQSVKLRELTGFKADTIRHYIRLSIKLTQTVKNMLHSNHLSFSIAKVLASLPLELQDEEAQKVKLLQTSVTRLRARFRKHDSPNDNAKVRQFRSIADHMAAKTGLMVAIEPSKHDIKAGKVVFTYTNLSEFDTICDSLGCNLNDALNLEY